MYVLYIVETPFRDGMRYKYKYVKSYFKIQISKLFNYSNTNFYANTFYIIVTMFILFGISRKIHTTPRFNEF